MLAWTNNNKKNPEITIAVRQDREGIDYFRLAIDEITILFDEKEFLKLYKEVEETYLSYDFGSIDNA